MIEEQEYLAAKKITDIYEGALFFKSLEHFPRAYQEEKKEKYLALLPKQLIVNNKEYVLTSSRGSFLYAPNTKDWIDDIILSTKTCDPYFYGDALEELYEAGIKLNFFKRT